MLIKILEGTFGALENGVVVAKTSRSAPFEVDEKRGRVCQENERGWTGFAGVAGAGSEWRGAGAGFRGSGF